MSKTSIVPKSPFSAFITNLGKYNEGELIGKWLAFPTTAEKYDETLREIGIDGKRYEEIFISDYDCRIDGLYDQLGETYNIDELNYLAKRIAELDEHSYCKLQALLVGHEVSGGPYVILNAIEDLDMYTYIDDIEDETALGMYMAQELGYMTKENSSIMEYFNFEEYGCDIALNDNGKFVCGCYISSLCVKSSGEYFGICDIPAECRVRPV